MSKPQSKKCSKCNELKSLEEFPRNRGGKYGRHSQCLICRNRKDKESKERLQNTPCSVCKTAPRLKGQTRCSDCHRAKNKESRKRLQNTPCSVCKTEPRIKNKTICSGCHRARMAKSRYGVTEEQYKELYTDPACACCGRTPEEIGGEKPMHIDHCHEGGQVRALLCRYCNVALGMLYEDITRVRQLGSYILKHKYDVVTTQEHKTTPDRRVSGLVMQLP